MKELHTRVYDQMLEAEMDNHLGYEKHSNQGDHSGNSRNGSYKKQIQILLSAKTQKGINIPPEAL